MVGAVFVLDELEPLGGHLGQVGQVAFYLLYFGTHACHHLLGLVFVELQDALHLDFHQSENVVACHLTYHLWIERLQTLVDVFAGGIHRGGVLKGTALVDALLDEDFLQRGEMQLLEQLAAPYLQLFAYQVFGLFGRVAQHVANSEELRFVVLDDAAVG